MPRSLARLPLGPSQRKLLLALAVMGVVVLVEGVLGASVARRADAAAREMFATSLASIRELSRVGHDVAEERRLINERLLEKDASATAAIETRLAKTRADIREAMQRYTPGRSLPKEEELWRRAQVTEVLFQQRIGDVLELSREGRDVEARGRLAEGHKDAMDLDGNLVELIQLNLAGAGKAMDRVRGLQQRAETVEWGARIAGLVVLLTFGVWGTRRIVRYETQLADYARQIEAQNHDLDAFAGRVAHDLRNALGPIVMSAPMLKRCAADPPEVHRIADRVERCSRRAISIVDSLLAFSRATYTGDAEASGQLRIALRSVQEELAPQLARGDVTMSIAEMPEVELQCSPGLLHVVLANLCGNAVKYVAGQKERMVRVSAVAEDGLCRIEVADTGPGIAKALHEKIFEPFFRVGGTAAPGTGIGLATVRRILEARGGRIAVQSEVGQGACFIVWLPIAAVASRPDAPASANRGASSSRDHDEGSGSVGMREQRDSA